MKIGIISDLHIDRHKSLKPKDYERELIKVMFQKQIELLLIAGDISNHYKLTHEFIESIEAQSQIKVLFIPGNHDFWSSDTNVTSAEILNYYMDMNACLIGKPYSLNANWAIVGNTGWYDYTYASPEFSLERIARRKYYGATWQDKVKIDWPIENRKLSRIAARQATQDIEKVKHKNIILMTHIVTHPKFAVPMPHRIFDYFNAFIGTSDFNEIYQQYPIRYSIMGHVHFRNEFEERGVTYICPCLGYQREWRSDDLATEIKHAMSTLDI
ncbi:metallophosphoesterase [Staphylococcus edaphicus]|uniref:Metallophosphoesterase n=1 Tax=Staphylococcus edaphicus TaxID=1955013 RepID=A0A2C6WPA0_9STAP|nr:metallophosphoesterase [Staphylococcus edaphicus]PHK49576.1 phosphohydrolase [Staphylococcus edaphicus]UQW82007.1 metallophosphoesterase [Staphylococcus edaphicus]